MNIEINIPEEETEVAEWLKSLKHQGSNFNDKIVSVFKVYMHLVKNVEWSVLDKSMENKWGAFEDKFQTNIEALTGKLNQKIEVFQVQLEESVSKPIKGEFQKLQDTIDVFRGDSLVSSKKGKIGELQIERQIESYFPGAEITDKSKQPHQSDYHLKLYDKTIFVEVKTYQKNVPHKEITKFYRDLEENPEADAGIMLSLTSGISNTPKFTYSIHESTKKPIVFVPNAAKGNGESVIWAILFVSLVLKYQDDQVNNSDANNKSCVEDILEMVRNQLQWVEMAINNITDIQEITKKHYQNLTQQTEKYYKDMHEKSAATKSILKKNVDTWNEYLKHSTKIILPLPSMSQQQTKYKCHVCSKVYKLERHYISHLEKCQKNDTHN